MLDRFVTHQPDSGSSGEARLLNMFADPVHDVAFSLVFLLVTVYGISAILFLTQSLLSVSPIVTDADFIRVASSLLSVVLALGVLSLFVRIEGYLATNGVKYLLLIGLTCLVTLGVQRFMWMHVLKKMLQHPGPAQFHKNILYLFSPAIAVCLYFCLWQRANSFSRTIRKQTLELVRLSQLKTQAELTALQARINPHFLYNTLNSISSLVYSDPVKADDMVIELAKLFQSITNASARLVAPIADEIEFVNGYLRIEQYRFGDRLRYTIDVGPGLAGVDIPRFLLQPIVENAVKHSISNRIGAGQLRVVIYRQSDWLYIAVQDDGPPFSTPMVMGYGLSSIHETLRLLYAGQASLTLQNTPCKQVLIRMPFA